MQRSVNMVLFVGIFHTGLMNHRKSDTSNLNTTSILHKGPCWIRILDHILQMIRHSLDSHEKMKISIVKPIWFSFGKIFWDFFSVLRHFTDDSCRHVDSLKLDLGIFLRQYKRFDPRIWAFFCRISAVFTSDFCTKFPSLFYTSNSIENFVWISPCFFIPQISLQNIVYESPSNFILPRR